LSRGEHRVGDLNPGDSTGALGEALNPAARPEPDLQDVLVRLCGKQFLRGVG
jgi:hypothetical protein